MALPETPRDTEPETSFEVHKALDTEQVPLVLMAEFLQRRVPLQLKKVMGLLHEF